MEVQVRRWLKDGVLVRGVLGYFWRGNDMSIAAKVGVVGDMVDLTILLSSVTWVLNAGERKRMAFDMKCLKRIPRVNLMNRIRNEDMRKT